MQSTRTILTRGSASLTTIYTYTRSPVRAQASSGVQHAFSLLVASNAHLSRTAQPNNVRVRATSSRVHEKRRLPVRCTCTWCRALPHLDKARLQPLLLSSRLDGASNRSLVQKHPVHTPPLSM